MGGHVDAFGEPGGFVGGVVAEAGPEGRGPFGGFFWGEGRGDPYEALGEEVGDLGWGEDVVLAGEGVDGHGGW